MKAKQLTKLLGIFFLTVAFTILTATACSNQENERNFEQTMECMVNNHCQDNGATLQFSASTVRFCASESRIIHITATSKPEGTTSIDWQIGDESILEKISGNTDDNQISITPVSNISRDSQKKTTITAFAKDDKQNILAKGSIQAILAPAITGVTISVEHATKFDETHYGILIGNTVSLKANLQPHGACLENNTNSLNWQNANVDNSDNRKATYTPTAQESKDISVSLSSNSNISSNSLTIIAYSNLLNTETKVFEIIANPSIPTAVDNGSSLSPQRTYLFMVSNNSTAPVSGLQPATWNCDPSWEDNNSCYEKIDSTGITGVNLSMLTFGTVQKFKIRSGQSQNCNVSCSITPVSNISRDSQKKTTITAFAKDDKQNILAKGSIQAILAPAITGVTISVEHATKFDETHYGILIG